MDSFIPIPSLRDVESQHLGAQLVAHATAMAGADGIDEFAATGWLPDSFFDELSTLYSTYDAYIAHNIAASELKIMCKFGCTRCCKQAVHGVYSFEIINLYRQLRTSPDYPRIHDTFVAQANAFTALLVKFRQSAPDTPAGHRDALTMALRAYAGTRTPCALLLDDNCRVYESRPVPCRMYHSLTDPVICVTPIGRTFNLEPPEAANRILSGLNDRLAFPFSNFLAQGLVSFASRRQFRPWVAPTGGA